MKYLFILAIVFILGLFYINRTYAYFYDFQGDHFIVNPFYPQTLELGDKGESLKLVMLGDSLMAGTGSTSIENSLAYLIADSFAQDSKVTLLNYASPGVGVKNVLEHQLPKTFDQQPNYIVLMIGTNDVHNKMSANQFADYYNKILKDLTEKTKAKITVVNIPYIGSDKILFAPWNSIADLRIQEFNKIIEDEAQGKQIPVVDLYSEFRQQFKAASELYSEDQFHPSDRGYALWADYLNANLNR